MVLDMQSVVVQFLNQDGTIKAQMLRQFMKADIDWIAEQFREVNKCTVRIMDSDLNLIVEKEYTDVA